LGEVPFEMIRYLIEETGGEGEVPPVTPSEDWVMSIETIGNHSTAVHGEGSLALLYTPVTMF
jgi:hypothetical protein